jgi:hypothetical protein
MPFSAKMSGTAMRNDLLVNDDSALTKVFEADLESQMLRNKLDRVGENVWRCQWSKQHLYHRWHDVPRRYQPGFEKLRPVLYQQCCLVQSF